METADRIQLVRRLTVTVLVMTFVLMVLGSWVKATGSGLSCPDWPQCYGEWFPPFPSKENGGTDPTAFDSADAYSQAQILYEWSHRLVASLLGVPFVAMAVVAFRGRDLHPALRRLPLVAGGLLAVQIALGGITVVGKNAAPLTTAHLATATLFLITIVWTTAFAFLRPKPQAVQVEVKRVAGEKVTVFPGEEPRP